MAKTKDKKGTRSRQSVKKGGKKYKFIKKFKFFAKYALAPFPDESGSPFYSIQGSEKKMFKDGKIAESRTGGEQGNSELTDRIGMGISLGSATFDFGTETMQKKVPVFEDAWFKEGDNAEAIKAQLEGAGATVELA